MDKLKKFVIKHKILILLILLALLLRLPWLYTTIEKDEGAFGYTAWQLLSGDTIYTDTTDNKPPLIYILYLAPILFFGNSIIPVRLFNNFLFLISIFFFFRLAQKLSTKKIAVFSTLFYIIFMNVPVFEGYLAMSESFLTPFLIISIYLFKKYVSSNKHCFLFISSVFAVITILIKQQAIFIYLLLIGGLFIYKKQNKIKGTFFIFSPCILIFIIMIFMNKELFLNLLTLTYKQIVQSPAGFSSGYVSFNYNLIILLEGSLLWLFSIIGIVKILRSKLNENNIFIILWFLLALAFTITPPAYGHYYQFLIPSLAILSGMGMVYVIKSKQDKKMFIFLIIILFLLTGGLIIKHYPDSQLNLGRLHWGWSNLENYQQQIILSEYIKNITSTQDKILIWGWEPSIYWLSERKHITRGVYTFCDSPRNWERFEKKCSFKKDLKTIIFLPGYERKCENMTKEIFSDLILDWNKNEIGDVEIYTKPAQAS